MMVSDGTACSGDNSSEKGYGNGACPKEAAIFRLPEDVWEKIVLNLSAQDVLSLICANRWLYTGLGQSENIWRLLSQRDGSSCYEESKETTPSQRLRNSVDTNWESKNGWKMEKYRYLLYCHRSNPSQRGGGVHWYPVRPYGRFAGISDREGHISCVLSRHVISDPMFDPRTQSTTGSTQRNSNLRDRIVVVTGGFADDDSIYLIHAGTGVTPLDESSVSDNRHHWAMERKDPVGGAPSFVYGASLTALPTLYDYSETTQPNAPHKLTATMRAIRFGGFRAGGYSNESSQVVMLTVKQDANRVQKRQRKRRGKRDKLHDDDMSDADDGDSWCSTWEWHWNRPSQVRWSNISTTGIPPGRSDEANSVERDFLSRAYHTSTLLLDRYLVVIGGMKSTGSVLNESVLDTKTWKWIGNEQITRGSDATDSRPSGRHGHSIILDDSRNRLVLFGGGSGSDLLRSGEDNSEVWELQLGESWRDRFEESFPWKWKKLHGDCNDNDQIATGETKLTPSQTLCLGRCHNGIKISRDTALFVFGSGRPSTNGILAYDLQNDSFWGQQQPQNSSAVHVRGILPKPRFTGVAAFLEEDGYVITHGGYCSQDHETIGTIDVLDLAPGFRGRLNPRSTFDRMSIDERRVSYGEVTDSQAERGRRDPNAAMQRMLQTIMNTPAGERQEIARGFLNEMRRGERPWNEETYLFMTMIANGSPLFMGHEEDNISSDAESD